MITADDLEFHHDADSDYTWAETYFIPISIPEANLFAFVYVCTRPVVGAMTNCIRVTGAISETEWEVLYDDNQEHLPCAERFSLIDAPNGLRIEAVKPPREYRIDYVGYDDTEIHVDWRGIMDPWDIHDTNLNPLVAGKTEAERHASTSMGAAYKGHFDMHGRVTGTVKVRGKTYQVDTIDRMNHSWGPRPTLDIPSGNAMWGAFGEDFGFRMHCHLDLDKPTGQDQRLAHGYLLDRGDVLAVMDLKIATNRIGIVPATIDLAITDERDRTWTVHGQVINGAPWRSYLTTVTWLGLFRWIKDCEVGYGVAREQPGEWKVSTVEVDDPKAGEVLVEMVGSGLCHSDDHLRTGDVPVEHLPVCGGHEGAGIVRQVGPGVYGLEEGDHIITSFVPSCGRCKWCAQGLQQLCDNGALLLKGTQIDGTCRMHLDGTDIGTMTMLGTFSEWQVLDQLSCIKICKDVPLESACIVACGVPTGWGSAINAGKVRPGDVVIVMGIGVVGVNAVQGRLAIVPTRSAVTVSRPSLRPA